MNICNNLPFYLYDEMPKEERDRFEKHLAECPECKSAIKLFGEVREAKTVYNAPVNVVNNIFEGTTRKRNIFAISKTWKLGIAAAACLMIGVFSVPMNKKQANFDFTLTDNSDSIMEEIASINADLDEFEDIFFA